MFFRLAFPLLHFLAPRFLPKAMKFARLVWRLTFDKRVSIFLRVLVPLALIYVISPYDILSDRIPILGRFDDLIIMGLALLFLTKLAPPPPSRCSRSCSAPVRPWRSRRTSTARSSGSIRAG